MIEDIGKLSISFVFPISFTIIVWIIVHLIDNDNWKMHLRTYAWSSVILLIFALIYELVVVSAYPDSYILTYFREFLPLSFFVIPIFPIIIVSKILARYKIALQNIKFFTAKGKAGTIKRYVTFLSFHIYYFLILIF